MITDWSPIRDHVADCEGYGY